MSDTPTTSNGAIEPNPASPTLYDGLTFGSKEALDAVFAETFGDLGEQPGDTAPAEGEKPKTEPADKPDAKAKADEPVADAKDPDLEEIRAINARSRARREAFRKSREAARPAPAAQAAPAAAAKPPEPAPAAPSNEVTKAVADVLAEIQKLAADDTAPAAEQTPKDERAAAILALQAKLDKIAETTTVNADLQKKLDDATTRLAAMEKNETNRVTNARFIVEQVKPILDELPTLRAHVPTLKEPRTAVEMIEAAAGRYLEKFGSVPDMKEIARRIEKKLAPETETKTETPSTKSKTVSSKLSSPPAARSGPDKRTKAEIEADLDAWVESVT